MIVDQAQALTGFEGIQASKDRGMAVAWGHIPHIERDNGGFCHNLSSFSC
jgi:hypothetical protein